MSAFDLQVEDDGLATLTFDLPGEKVNKFSTAVLEELADVLVRLTREARIRGLLIRSGKPDIFIAGADVKEFTQVRPEDVRPGVERVQSLFEQLAHLPYPTVAAIHGACLGGGTELALACDYRLMSDSKKAQIGLPEVRLGIFPAWGGCTRLPKIVGLAAALDLILTGKTLDARRARRNRPRRRGGAGGDLRGTGPALRPREARDAQAPDAARAQGARRPRPRGDAVRAPDDLREGPGRRDEADGRPLPGPARGARGRGGRVRQARRRSASRPRPGTSASSSGERSRRTCLRIFFMTEEVKKETGVVGSLGPPARSDAPRSPGRRSHGRGDRPARRGQGTAVADEGRRPESAGPRLRRPRRRSGARRWRSAACPSGRWRERSTCSREPWTTPASLAARSRSRPSSRSSRSSARSSSSGKPWSRRTRDLRVEHLDAADHRDRRRRARARPRRRNALLQPGASDAARRGHPRRAHERRDRGHGLRPREDARQDSRRRQGRPGLPRQPDSRAVPVGGGSPRGGRLPHRGRGCGDDPLRNARRAARPPRRRRARRRGEGRRSAPGGVSGAAADGRGGRARRGRPSRPQERQGLLRVRGRQAREAGRRGLRRPAGVSAGSVSVAVRDHRVAPRASDDQRGRVLPRGRHRPGRPRSSISR